VWRGTDPLILGLESIPRHADSTKIGDLIETSGFSNLFPEGIPLGVIDDLKKPEGENNFIIDVKLSNDIYNLKYAYVVKHLLLEDLKKLDE